MAVYLDCNATTPIEPEVADIVRYYTEIEFGNSGSRTHEFGTRAKQAVLNARQSVASVLPGIDESDIVFTSGATESNNLAVLGLLRWAKTHGKNHIVTTSIEHKAVLEPLDYAESVGFKVTRVAPGRSGAVSAADVLHAVQHETCLVTVMHVNNETGIIQPINKIADGLPERDCYFHVDAAQGFGKEYDTLNHSRIDLISLSGHKIFGPKGIGALIMRRQKFKRPPLTPLMYGGGQERGLRPGTLPVALIAGLGVAASLCKRDSSNRNMHNQVFRTQLLKVLEGLDYSINGMESLSVPHAVNISFNGLNSEAVILALKGVVALSNGSACTSQAYTPSHVLKAMRLSDSQIESAVRFSWCHMTPDPDWNKLHLAIASLK
jgi:cysteine desulfurase